jgi:transcriptional regulator with XRE-family HTH domain
MGVRFWHVGDVIRKLRDQHGLSATTLAQTAGVSRSEVVELESLGPEVEQATPAQWQALDRLAVAFGLGNGASLYKLIPETSAPRRRPGPIPVATTSSRVVPFDRRRAKPSE